LKIAQTLNHEGRATKCGRPWWAATVRSVLSSSQKIAV
jgi:hypothetical protein